jgi:hypothetical protein
MIDQPATDEPLLIDAAGLAKMLQVSKRHVQVLDASGRIPAGISLGRCKRWDLRTIHKWRELGYPSRAKMLALDAGPRLRLAGGGR